MASISKDIQAGLCTTKHDDVVQRHFAAGTEVEIIKEWEAFWLIKDADGHFYNLPKDAVSP